MVNRCLSAVETAAFSEQSPSAGEERGLAMHCGLMDGWTVAGGLLRFLAGSKPPGVLGMLGLVVQDLACGSPLPLVAGAGGPGGNVQSRGGASVFTHFVVKYLKGAVAVPETAP